MTDTVTVPREAWGEYKRSQIAHLRPYLPGETLSERVSISMADLEAGSPKDGDMIARNPANHDDQWLVASDYFAANFEPAMLAAAPKAEPLKVAPASDELLEALKEIRDLGSDGEHSGDRHAKCRAIARAAHAKHKGPQS